MRKKINVLSKEMQDTEEWMKRIDEKIERKKWKVRASRQEHEKVFQVRGSQGGPANMVNQFDESDLL